MKWRNRAVRDNGGHEDKCRSAGLADRPLADLPRHNRGDDPAEPLGQPGHQPTCHLRHVRPRRGGSGGDAIGAERRCHRHHR